MTSTVRTAPAVRATISRTHAVALVSFMLSVALLGAALFTVHHPYVAVVWGSVSLATYAVGLLCLIGNGRGALAGLGRWRIGSWMMLWYGFAYGLLTALWNHPQTGTQAAAVSITSVLSALWLVAGGMTAWTLGYLLGAGKYTQKLSGHARAAIYRRFVPTVRSASTPWLLFAIGAAARLILILSVGGYDHFGSNALPSADATPASYQQALVLLTFFATFGVAAAALRTFRERARGSWPSLVIMASLDLAFDAAAGTKLPFAYTFLAILIPYCAARRRSSMVITAIALIVALIVIVPLTVAYRQEEYPTGSSTGAIAALAPSFIAHAAANGQYGFSSANTSYAQQRLTEISDPAMIVQLTPSAIPFANPWQLIIEPISYTIPRLLWPGKPGADAAYQFSERYWHVPASVHTPTAISPIGDLYMYGGWVPVIAGMFVYGWALRLFDDACDIHCHPATIFLLLILGVTQIISETPWVYIFAGLPWNILAWFTAACIAFRRKQQSSPVQCQLR